MCIQIFLLTIQILLQRHESSSKTSKEPFFAMTSLKILTEMLKRTIGVYGGQGDFQNNEKTIEYSDHLENSEIFQPIKGQWKILITGS